VTDVTGGNNQLAGRWTVNKMKLALWPVFLSCVAAFMVIPLLISLSVSVTTDSIMTFPPKGFSWRWYREIISDSVWTDAFLDTMVIGSICAAIATTIGTLSAYGITRIHHESARNWILVVFLGPLAVPFVSLGMSVYPVFAWCRLIGTHLGVALAQAVISIPFVVLAVLASIRRSDRDLESAARTLGARPLQAFYHVTLPMLRPGILAGAILSFMTSLDDVIMPIFLGGANVSTVPKTMFDAVALSTDPSVMAASTLMSTVGVVLFLVVGALRRSRALGDRS
jgi:putative spermidine/putrescine transport system permease protein